MARAQSPNFAGSQFFIMHEDGEFLDGQYAAFGKVLEGMDVVDKIAAVKTDGSDRPLSEQKIASIRASTQRAVPRNPTSSATRTADFNIKKLSRRGNLRRTRAALVSTGAVRLDKRAEAPGLHKTGNFFKLTDNNTVALAA